MITFGLLPATIAIRDRAPSPIGQQYFTTAGNHEWTCPEGVYEVCVAMMGAGGSSAHQASADVNVRYVGAGGNLRYKNKIPVVPGQKYNIFVPGPIAKTSNPATAFGLSTANPVTADFLGADGGQMVTSQGQSALGFNAGGAPAGQNGYGFDLVTFTAVTATAPGFSTTNRVGNIPGGGAGIFNGGSQYPYFSAAGAVGAVRIIWGDDRAFPNKNIGNL